MADELLARKVVETMLARDCFSQWLGVRLIKIGLGQVEIEMTVRKEMLNGFARCHGGIPFSLADSALAFAANTHGQIAVAIDNTIPYPAPINDGDTLRASAGEIKCGNQIGFYDVTVTNQHGHKVAVFRGTVYRTGKDYLS